MAEFEHLSKEKLDGVVNRIWEVESSLTGLSGLFRIREETGSASLDTDELYGLGQALKDLAEKLSVQEDILKCGFDSMAVTGDSLPPETEKRTGELTEEENQGGD